MKRKIDNVAGPPEESSLWKALRATHLKHLEPYRPPVQTVPPGTDEYGVPGHLLLYTSKKSSLQNCTLPLGTGRIVVEDRYDITIKRPKLHVSDNSDSQPVARYVYMPSTTSDCFKYEVQQYTVLQRFAPNCTEDNPTISHDHTRYKSLQHNIQPPTIEHANSWDDFQRRLQWQTEEANRYRPELESVVCRKEAVAYSHINDGLHLLGRDNEVIQFQHKNDNSALMLGVKTQNLFTIYLEHTADNKLEYRIWLDMAALDRAVMEQAALPDYGLLRSCVRSLHNEHVAAQYEYYHKTSVIPDSNDHTEFVQPPAVVVPLHDYQLRSLTWMTTIEDQLAAPLTHVKQYSPESEIPLIIPGTRWAIGPNYREHKASFTHHQFITVAETTYTFRGGILADQMGCGKTATALALCSARPFNIETIQSIQYPQKAHQCPHMTLSSVERYLPSRATLVFVPPNIVKQWLDEATKFYGRPIETTSTRRPFLPATDEMGAIHVIRDKRDWKQISYWDVMEAHMIIVSYQFIVANIYRSSLSPDLEGYVTPLIRRADPQLLATTCQPVLEHILWHRIIYDEFHDTPFKGRGEASQVFSKLEAKSYWGLTGTPDITNPDELMQQVEHLLHSGPISPGNSCGPLDALQIVQHRMCRNIYNRKLPAITHQVIWIKQTTTEMALYQAFRNIHDINCANLVMACSHHQIAERLQFYLGGLLNPSGEPLTIDQVATQIQTAREEEIAGLISQVDTLAGEIKDITDGQEDCQQKVATTMLALQQMEQNVTSLRTSSEVFVPDTVYYELIGQQTEEQRRMIVYTDQMYQLEQQLAIVRPKHVNAQKILTQAESEYRFFNLFIKGYKEGKEMECPICVDPIAPDCLTVTPCGHEFCNECIATYYSTLQCSGSGMCPTCKRPTTQNQLFALKTVQPSVAELEVDPLQQKYGSKLVALIRWLQHNLETPVEKDDPPVRILVFSQFRSLSNLISRALSENNIHHLSVKGSTLDRQKTIDNWRQHPNIQVLLLNAESSASGLNLTEATHVVLLHPFLSAEEIGHRMTSATNAHQVAGVAAEHQCITRAYRQGLTHPVKVVRFATLQTLEEELTLQHTSDLADVLHVGRPVQ